VYRMPRGRVAGTCGAVDCIHGSGLWLLYMGVDIWFPGFDAYFLVYILYRLYTG